MNVTLKIEKRVQNDIKRDVISNIEKKLKDKVIDTLTEILQSRNFYCSNLHKKEDNIFIYYGKNYLENGTHICVSFHQSKIMILVVENDLNQKTFKTYHSYRHNEIKAIINNIDFLQEIIDK